MSAHELAPLPDPEFLSGRRSTLLGLPTYREMASDAIETFQIVTASLTDRDKIARMDPARPMGATRTRAWDSVKYLHVQYSAGIHPVHLKSFFPEAVVYWSEYAIYDKAFDDSPAAGGRRVPHIDLHDTDFWHAIRLTSFAILLGHTNLLPRIAALWDYENDDMDGLLERLIAPFVLGRPTPPDTCARHLPYFKLLKVFAAEEAKRPALMAKYMDEWYAASRREPYYESHTKGRDHSFLGYWSFEAAAVTYVLDIDDASFRDHEFYPKDLIDFARSLPRPAVLGGGPSAGATAPQRLHCPAGLPCPRTGFWFSPALPGSSRHFDAGDIMPDLGGDYGETIWQWDERQ